MSVLYLSIVAPVIGCVTGAQKCVMVCTGGVRAASAASLDCLGVRRERRGDRRSGGRIVGALVVSGGIGGVSATGWGNACIAIGCCVGSEVTGVFVRVVRMWIRGVVCAM